MKTSPYQFQLNTNGRCGTISCTKDDLKLEMDWEMSGIPDMDLLLAPIDLTRWTSGETVPNDEQRVILEHLRYWLAAKKTRADINRPTEETDHTREVRLEWLRRVAAEGICLLRDSLRRHPAKEMKKQNKSVVATADNVSRSLRSGRLRTAVPHF